MAITSLEYSRAGAQRTVSYDGAVFTVNEPVIIETDDTVGTSTTNPLFFVGDPMFPAIGDAHPEEGNLRFHNIGSASQKKEHIGVWDMTLIYKSNQPDTTTEGGDPNFNQDRYDNPTIANKQWSFKSVQMPRRPSVVSDDDQATYSDDAMPITTTAGEPIMVTESKYLPVCTYTRNELTVPNALLSFVGSVNNDSITIDGLPVAPGAALVSNVSISDWKRDQGTYFRTVTYMFTLNDDTWDLQLLNRGIYGRVVADDGSEVEPVKVPGYDKDSNLVPARTPQLLKYTGNTWRDDGTNTALENFLGGTTTRFEWRDALTAETPASFHVRYFRHPQYTAFTPYGFS